MNALLLFWTFIFLIVAVLVVVREVIHDEPNGRLGGYVPPRSHEVDPFERTGSTWR